MSMRRMKPRNGRVPQQDMLACLAFLAMLTAGCHEPPYHSCGQVDFTFSALSSTNPDVGTGWKASAGIATANNTLSPPVEFLTAEDAQAQLQIHLPAPIGAGQTINATFVDGMSGLHNVYFSVNGARQGSWYSTGGTMHVDSLDPIQLSLTNVTMDVYPFYPGTIGAFTMNGSGEWSAAPLPCSVEQP